MIARAPGKLVLSGAYAVLEGAPAITASVSRYAYADASRRATIVTPEVRCALGELTAPYLDTSELRTAGRKLGLGSSAAGLVASLAALLLRDRPDMPDDEVRERVWPEAVRAHRLAQGGGSGIDVVTSALGGVRICWLDQAEIRTCETRLPRGVSVDVYLALQPASTPAMLAAVRRAALTQRSQYDRVMDWLREASRAAAVASDADALLEALRAQAQGLAALGDIADVPIFGDPIRTIAGHAADSGTVILPSGAGGGDVVLCVGGDTRAQWKERLEEVGLQALPLSLGVPGVQRAAEQRK